MMQAVLRAKQILAVLGPSDRPSDSDVLSMLELHEFEKNRSRKNVMRLADEERGSVITP